MVEKMVMVFFMFLYLILILKSASLSLFSNDVTLCLVSKFTTTADGRESSSSKQVQEDEMTTEKTQANDAEAANDINAAKVAALKAAELGMWYLF